MYVKYFFKKINYNFLEIIFSYLLNILYVEKLIFVVIFEVKKFSYFFSLINYLGVLVIIILY